MLPAVGEWPLGVVAVEALGAESSEQLHHGEVVLAVTAVERRVDQPRPACPVDHPVACPQVAVEARRRFVGDAELVEPTDRVLECIEGVVGQRAAVERDVEQRVEPSFAEEVRPVRARAVRQGQEPVVR